MKYYVELENNYYFNVRALSFKQAHTEVQKIIDKVSASNNYNVQLEPFNSNYHDYQFRVNRRGELVGHYYCALRNKIIPDEMVV